MEQQVYIELAEYVAGGRPLKISQELISLVKRCGAFRKYSQLYRIWFSIDAESVVEKLRRGQPVKVQRTHATTRSWASVEAMYSEEGYEGYPVLVTRYTDVIGFDPIEVLRKGLELGLAGEEVSFVKRAVIMHEHQKEICTLQPIVEIREKDVYKVLND